MKKVWVVTEAFYGALAGRMSSSTSIFSTKEEAEEAFMQLAHNDKTSSESALSGLGFSSTASNVEVGSNVYIRETKYEDQLESKYMVKLEEKTVSVGNKTKTRLKTYTVLCNVPGVVPTPADFQIKESDRDTAFGKIIEEICKPGLFMRSVTDVLEGNKSVMKEFDEYMNTHWHC